MPYELEKQSCDQHGFVRVRQLLGNADFAELRENPERYIRDVVPKLPDPVLSPEPGGWDAAKCSEMCVIPLPRNDGMPLRYRMFYEACDGTAKNERDVWRIASATSTP